MSEVIRRIFAENPIVYDSRFHIVRDKDPVCPEHYLVFPRTSSRSLAGLPSEQKEYLESLLCAVFGDRGFLFLERGNAKFCTSMNEPSYAHGHLVGTRYFKPGIMRHVGGFKSCIKASTLKEGLALLDCEQEYLLAGELRGNWSAVISFNTPIKRYIRTILGEMRA